MPDDSEERYYAQRTLHALAVAAATTDRAVKSLHLDLAACYATLRERALEIHRSIDL